MAIIYKKIFSLLLERFMFKQVDVDKININILSDKRERSGYGQAVAVRDDSNVAHINSKITAPSGQTPTAERYALPRETLLLLAWQGC